MKYVLYGFGGSYNHGGEAIIQTTCEMIRAVDKKAEIVLTTHFIEQDKEFNLPVDKYCVRSEEALKKEKEDGNQNRFTEKVYRETLDEISKDTIVMSVGGDNYCYSNWEKWMVIHDYARKKGAITIFWSCSIEPGMVSEQMRNHLMTFDVIIARESQTYNKLIQVGLKNVRKCLDVAFLLKSKEINYPNGFEENNTIAVNLSPLVLRREKTEGVILRNIVQCIEDILEQTAFKILLIPHVLMPVDNDVEALKEIKSYFQNEDRVILFSENRSAGEYKYLISKCRFGVFARTHASIAAYSSMVPSIVLGYSVKSIGIAGDLDVNEYVLPIEQLEEGQLSTCFFRMLSDEESIKDKLVRRKADMVNGALVCRDTLEEMLQKKHN